MCALISGYLYLLISKLKIVIQIIFLKNLKKKSSIVVRTSVFVIRCVCIMFFTTIYYAICLFWNLNM